MMLYHYTIKAVQLWFICSWHEAKLAKNSFEKLRTFQRLRYVLEPRTYFVGLAVLVMLCSVPIIYALTSRSVYADAAATNGYQTLRCEWWDIPGQHHTQHHGPALLLTRCTCAGARCLMFRGIHSAKVQLPPMSLHQAADPIGGKDRPLLSRVTLLFTQLLVLRREETNKSA